MASLVEKTVLDKLATMAAVSASTVNDEVSKKHVCCFITHFLKIFFSYFCSCLQADNEEGDDEEEGENEVGTNGKVGEGDKKKKKKRKSTKKKAKSAGAPVLTGSKPPHSRLVTGFTDYYIAYGQTDPPTRPVSELFPSGGFPVGDIQPHGKTKYPDPLSSYARCSQEENRCVYF